MDDDLRFELRRDFSTASEAAALPIMLVVNDMANPVGVEPLFFLDREACSPYTSGSINFSTILSQFLGYEH